MAEVCASDPWTLDTPGMELALDVATLASLSRAALAAMRVLNDARRRDDAAPPAVALAAAGARVDRLRRARLAIADAHLVLHCPRCHTAFIDFDGCAALTCGVAGCGQHFCSLCFYEGTSREVTCTWELQRSLVQSACMHTQVWARGTT